MTRFHWFLVLLIVVLAGCEGLSERSKYLTGPEVFEWNRDDFRVKGNDAMLGGVNLSQGELSVYFRGFPPGTRVSVGDLSETTDEEGGYLLLKAPVGPLYGEIATDDLSNASLDHLMIGVTPPGGELIEVPAPPMRVLVVEDWLGRIVDGPLLFTGEAKGASGEISNIYWHQGVEHHFFGTPAKTLREIQAIAIMETHKVGERTCTGYKDEAGRDTEVSLRLERNDVKIYDRRSGEMLRSKSFAPVDRCPNSTFSHDGEMPATGTVVPEDEIKAWLAAQLPIGADRP